MKKYFTLFFYLWAAHGMANPVFQSDTLLNVRDFGARGNGRSDDTKAIQTAICQAARVEGSTVFFPEGVYRIKSYTTTSNYLENYMIRLYSNIKIVGTGNKSIIRLGNHIFDSRKKSANAHLFYGLKTHSIEIANLKIDMNGSENIVPKGTLKNYSAIFTKYGSDYFIHNMTICNTAGRSMINIMGKGKGLNIENCRFINGGTYPGKGHTNPYQNDFSFVYSEWDHTTIANNLIVQENIEISLTGYTGGIEIHGSHSRVLDNTIIGCWPALYITSSMDTVMYDLKVQNNVMKDCLRGISFWVMDTIKNINISGNQIHLTYPRNNKLGIVSGILVPNGNSKVYSDKLANNAPIYEAVMDSNSISADSMSVLSAGMILHSLYNSDILQNTISGMNYAGIALAGSKSGIDSLLITKNSFKDFRNNPSPTAVGGFLVITDTYSAGKINTPGFKHILIENNSFVHHTLLIKGTGTFFEGFIALPKKLQGEVILKNNIFGSIQPDIRRINTN